MVLCARALASPLARCCPRCLHLPLLAVFAAITSLTERSLWLRSEARLLLSMLVYLLRRFLTSSTTRVLSAPRRGKQRWMPFLVQVFRQNRASHTQITQVAAAPVKRGVQILPLKAHAGKRTAARVQSHTRPIPC